MLKTMDVNVVWTGNIVVLNNFLILSGKVRSLIFNFDNRKIMTNVIELPDKEEEMGLHPGAEGGQRLQSVECVVLCDFEGYENYSGVSGR